MESGAPSSSPRRRYDARSRRAEAQARRRQVTREAQRLFLERGYAGTSIADIADAAGVSTQMVYAAFGGKAGILGRIVDVAAGGDDQEVLLRERPEARAARAADDPRTRLVAMARNSAAVNDRVGRVLAIVDSASGADESVRDLRDRIEAAIRDDTLAVAEEALTDLRSDLAIEEIADILRTIAGHRTWHALVVEGGWSQERYAGWLEDALARLLLEGA